MENRCLWENEKAGMGLHNDALESVLNQKLVDVVSTSPSVDLRHLGLPAFWKIDHLVFGVQYKAGHPCG